MITIIVTVLVLVYKSFCNTVYVFMVMQIKLFVVVVVNTVPERRNSAIQGINLG